MDSGLAPCESVPNQDPVLNRLKRKRDNLANQLEDVKTAIQQLEDNPHVLNILESLNKIGHY